MSGSNNEIKEDILKSFNTQFSENQNHQQKVFIQFLSAVLFVLVGYAYALVNTSLEADYFEVIKKEGEIVSYAISHFIYSYLVAQFVIAILALLVLNIGYSFRRDQLVVFNLRQHYLANGEYDEIFTKKSFNPKKLNFGNYLPGFNYIFFILLGFIQIGLFFSFYFIIIQFHNLPIFFYEYSIAFYLLFLFPILLTIFHYFYYYYKYNSRIKDNVKKYKVVFNEGKCVVKNKIFNYKSTPLLKTVGRIPYYLKKEGSVTFNHHLDKNYIHLVYLFIPKRVKNPYKALYHLINFITEYAEKNRVSSIEAIVVNPKISEDILKRNGWIFKKKNWYKGSHFIKHTTANTSV